MGKDWQRYSLGDILTLERRPIQLDSDKEYQEIGIYSFGRGIFHKTPRTGLEVGDKDLYLIKMGDFILQITFAWEGAVGLASEKEDGMYGSVRFPTFRVDENVCYPPFLLNYFRIDDGRNQLIKISPGSAGRNRVLSLKRIPEVFVPLPPLDEQRRIVARIEALAARVTQALRLRQQAVEEEKHLIQSIKSKIFFQSSSTCVRDFAIIQSGYAFKSEWFSEKGIRLIRNVNIGHGDISWSDIARLPDERRKEFSSFELNEGDILISLDRPLISTGLKASIIKKTDLPSLLVQRVGRVIFKSAQVLPQYFYEWLHSPGFIFSIDPGRSNGIPHISQKDIEKITFSPPSLTEQRRIVTYLDELQGRVGRLRRLQADSQRELQALLPSILDRAFKGEL